MFVHSVDKIPHHTSKVNYVRMVLHCAVTYPNITGAGRQLGLRGCEWLVPRRGGHPLPHPGGRQLGQHRQVTMCLYVVTTSLLAG